MNCEQFVAAIIAIATREGADYFAAKSEVSTQFPRGYWNASLMIGRIAVHAAGREPEQTVAELEASLARKKAEAAWLTQMPKVAEAA